MGSEISCSYTVNGTTGKLPMELERDIKPLEAQVQGDLHRLAFDPKAVAGRLNKKCPSSV